MFHVHPFFVGMVVCFLEFGILGLGCLATVLAQSQSNLGSMFVQATGMTELQVVLVHSPKLFRRLYFNYDLYTAVNSAML